MSESDDGGYGQDPLSSSPDCSSDDSELLVAAEAFARGYDSLSISSYPGERMMQGQEDTASLISTGTLVPECIYIPPAGYQLLSEQELAQQKAALKSTSERLEKVTQEKEALQEALRCSSEDCANQVKQLLDQIKNSEEILKSLQGNLSESQQKTARKMAALTASFSRLCQEVNSLNDENEKLRTLSSEAAPGEQFVQVSSQQRAAQHSQERLCIEVVTLQEELKAEKVAKADVEDQLRRQMETYTEERAHEAPGLSGYHSGHLACLGTTRGTWPVWNCCGMTVLISFTNVFLLYPFHLLGGIAEIMEATLSSMTTEMDRILQDRKQAELQLQESESQVQKVWESLGEQEKLLQKEKEERASLELALNEEKNKVSRIQAEMKTSEEVQRDFVRLSQTLQVSLEKIRQATSLQDVQDIVEGIRLTEVTQLTDA
ncbi:rab GTPase-binding effector protein 2 [Pseudophryne corroboree]|uniref:rab GTPase-binding effector protein 2 n=1 Tax=Pseudophryne corroboree TaxID=495146 RepID=UPI003081BA65